ncbi:hypothetical protein C474_07592 [Halogeometricum pallidum JCM 14848]|uniref:Uncharacterized protein n=1 Tax=Halogeometricum pallidum JCM 14848 TaxID=1227487 RepID=M0D983_HALPD|nr:hypothetical protein [Halogeometricum pallidum]ELZ32011.1 hypothetical protein C474_07592 [Halogeometricum pallidum JCM 14848]
MSEDDRAGEFGSIYLPALQRIRNLWLELEPLVEETLYDNVVAPTELQISLTDGLGDADTTRLDIQWSELGMYSFHYVDSEDRNWRFDRHPNTHSPEIHFHPPSDAAAVAAEPSCIDVTEVSLVTRAVHAMWRAAYENNDIEHLNSASNPL